MKIGLALRELHRAERDLAVELHRVADRHRADHDIFHLGHDLAGWSQEHVRLLVEAAGRYDERLDADPDDSPGALATAREKVSEALGRRPEPALLLLHDLRRVYLMAEGVFVDWELVAQAAQGVRDAELVSLTARCLPETLRQAKWANAKLKESATQILVS